MLKSLPTWLRSAVITAVQTFVGVFLASLVNTFGEVQVWIDEGIVPDFSILARTTAGAAVAAFVFVVTAAHRALRPVENTYPEQPHPGPLDNNAAV